MSKELFEINDQVWWSRVAPHFLTAKYRNIRIVSGCIPVVEPFTVINIKDALNDSGENFGALYGGPPPHPQEIKVRGIDGELPGWHSGVDFIKVAKKKCCPKCGAVLGI